MTSTAYRIPACGGPLDGQVIGVTDRHPTLYSTSFELAAAAVIVGPESVLRMLRAVYRLEQCNGVYRYQFAHQETW